MTRARTTTAAGVLLCVLAASAAGATGAADRPLTVPEYVARLDELAAAIDRGAGGAAQAAALANALPAVLRVDRSPGTFEIQTASIRRDVRAWRNAGDATVRRRLLDRLRALRTEAVRFEAPPAPSAARRAQLAAILAAREFQGIHGPTWADRLRQRVIELFVDLLGAVVRRSAIPTIWGVVVYPVMAAALLALVFVAVRLFDRGAAPPAVALDVPSAPIRDWPRWLADAQSASARGDWRRAVHSTYWCGVAFLEARGAWRPDRARTPREYLRLLPSSSAEGAPLAALTRRFELVWYGNANADAEAFAESMANLKRLGCPAA